MKSWISPMICDWLLAVFWSESVTTGLKWAYGSAFLVFIGVVGESIADLTSWVKDESRRRRIEKASALVLILGLAGDLVSVRMGQIEIRDLTQLAGDAKTSAKGAADAAARANESADAVGIKASQARAWALHLRPRYTSFDPKKFVASLRGVPPQKVEILYERENEEAYTIALTIAISLGPGAANAGWYVSGPRPVTERDTFGDLVRRNARPEDVPLIVRAGGSEGVGLIAKSADASGVSALREALANSGAFGVLHGYGERMMPDGLIRVVIGEQTN